MLLRKVKIVRHWIAYFGGSEVAYSIYVLQILRGMQLIKQEWSLSSSAELLLFQFSSVQLQAVL